MKPIIQSAPDPGIELRFLKIEGKPLYHADEPLTYLIDGRRLTIKVGFLTDLYSIPKLYQSLFSKTMLGIFAAIFHDACYKTDVFLFKRKEADVLLREIMKFYGVRFHTRWLVYWAVRTGGWGTWQKRKSEYHDHT
jgi:hypothetical protein